MVKRPEIAGDNYLATLQNCSGYYSCPKGPDGIRLGPLVGYAARYEGQGGEQLQLVGDVYANFAMAEIWPHVLDFFAECLTGCIEGRGNEIDKIDVLCGAPIGGYSLADALGRELGCRAIKAEKKVVALATANSREKTQLIWGRHGVEKDAGVVIVEDVCNNFSTTDQLVRLISESGGHVVGIVCFLNRSLEFDTAYRSTQMSCFLPVISLVRKPINEWRQNDPAVAEDIAAGNVAWKPKDPAEWARLMEAMRLNLDQ